MSTWERDFIEWHETVIAQYPPEIVVELRGARTKWLAMVRRL